eukprot:240569_1
MTEIPLEIHSYRGCYLGFHPKNLLSYGFSGYMSSTEYDARNDWITFHVSVCDDYYDEEQKEDDKTYDTLLVKIQNSSHEMYGVKQICLYLQYLDSAEWIKTKQINNIDRGYEYGHQSFPVADVNTNNLTM